MRVLLPVLFVLCAVGCGPRARVVWHKSQPVQGEPEPRTSLVEMLKYGAAAVSPEVAAVIAVEKILSGVSADWRTRKGETLLVDVPAPHGAGVALKNGPDGRPEQVLIMPVVRPKDPPPPAPTGEALAQR